MDILFINIIENKNSVDAGPDIELIKLVLSFYERYDVNHKNIASYYIIKALYEVAVSVILDPQNSHQDSLPSALNVMALETGGSSEAAEYLPVLPIPGGTEQDIWEGISHTSHNWLSAGVLQMVDWSLPPNTDE